MHLIDDGGDGRRGTVAEHHTRLKCNTPGSERKNTPVNRFQIKRVAASIIDVSKVPFRFIVNPKAASRPRRSVCHIERLRCSVRLDVIGAAHEVSR